MTIRSAITHSSELFRFGVVYNDNAIVASCNSEVFSRIEGLTIGSPGIRRHA